MDQFFDWNGMTEGQRVQFAKMKLIMPLIMNPVQSLSKVGPLLKRLCSQMIWFITSISTPGEKWIKVDIRKACDSFNRNWLLFALKNILFPSNSKLEQLDPFYQFFEMAPLRASSREKWASVTLTSLKSNHHGSVLKHNGTRTGSWEHSHPLCQRWHLHFAFFSFLMISFCLSMQMRRTPRRNKIYLSIRRFGEFYAFEGKEVNDRKSKIIFSQLFSDRPERK